MTAGSELQENVEQVLEGLEPHPNLQELIISGYRGVNFPHWLNNPGILKNIVNLTLSSCKNYSQLPPLWKLPSLRELSIVGDYLEYIHDDYFHGNLEARRFPCLESLSIDSLQNLKGKESLSIDSLQNLKGLSRLEERDIFPRVVKLNISCCPKLILPSLPLVKELDLWKPNKMMLSSISNLSGLTRLFLHGNNDVDSFPAMMLQMLTVLELLRVSKFTKLQTWSKDPVSLCSLKSMEFIDCPELDSFSEPGFQGMICLHSLCFVFCEKLTTLSEGLQHLTALESLSFEDCPNLVTLPYSI